MYTLILLIQYNLLLCLVICLAKGSIFQKNDTTKKGLSWTNKKLLILIVIVMGIFSAFRGSDEGLDYMNYLNFYNYILKYDDFSLYLKRNEFGWDYLNYIFASIYIPAEFFFGIITALIMIFFIKGAEKFYYLVPLMILLLLISGNYFTTYNTIRQALAVMIFFYSIKFILENNFIYYVFWIAVAYLFHSSALVMLPAFFLRYIQFNQKSVFILYIFSLLFLGNKDIINYSIDFVLHFASSSDLFLKYLEYSDSERLGTANRMVGSGLGFILRVITDLYILYMSKIVLQKEPIFKIYFLLYFLSAILSNFFFTVELVGRLLRYSQINLYVVFASSIYYSSNKYEKYIAVILVGVYVLLYNYLIYNSIWIRK